MKNVIIYLILIILLIFAIPLFFTVPKDTIETISVENVINSNVGIEKKLLRRFKYNKIIAY